MEPSQNVVHLKLLPRIDYTRHRGALKSMQNVSFHLSLTFSFLYSAVDEMWSKMLCIYCNCNRAEGSQNAYVNCRWACAVHRGPMTLLRPCSHGWGGLDSLVVNGTFSTNRLYCAMSAQEINPITCLP